MTVLSETTLRKYLRNGYIIVDGDKTAVRGPTYSCHAARVLPGGPGDSETQPTIVDWSPPTDADLHGVPHHHIPPRQYRIQPRQLVWVRIREIVRLPSDVCAFWWQTNSLSRKGLMLVNMSMVDPGYEGSLACLFVNFGRQPVDIDPGMTIARLVFHRLDTYSAPYGKGEDLENYDRQLREVALSGSSSFLSFQEFSEAFQDERKKAFGEFKRQTDEYARDLRSQVSKNADDAFKERADNLPRFLLKSYDIAFAGLALLTLASIVTPWFKDKIALDVGERIKTAVEAEIGKRLQPVSVVGTATTSTVEQRLQELETELRALRQQGRGGSPSGR